jgi:HAD superfamily hydrolase (TIGR01509 family)
MDLAGRLVLPDPTKAVLFDMDGVLLDSLGLDFAIVNMLLARHAGTGATVSMDLIRSLFALHPPEFWSQILLRVAEETGDTGVAGHHAAILAEYEEARRGAVFETLPGIPEILKAARERGLLLAVVSNNAAADVDTILERAGIRGAFDLVAGNDHGNLAQKPAPDTYLFAAQTLGVSPGACAVIEDSLIGAEAGRHAGCHTVAVSTGGHGFETLERSGFAHAVYSGFSVNRLSLVPGEVTKKRILTPNDFVSHMVEHVAWRLGAGIDLQWNNNSWAALGRLLGERVLETGGPLRPAAAIGMIDDGSAEVSLVPGDKGLALETAGGLSLGWFLSLRAEQAVDGVPMTRLLDGMAKGLGAGIHVRVCGMEDPHHTWEAVFRGAGVALAKARMPKTESLSAPAPAERAGTTGKPEPRGTGDLEVVEVSRLKTRVRRRTAESVVEAALDFTCPCGASLTATTGPSVRVTGLSILLDILARELGARLEVEFTASRLSSSHVAAEDTGLVLGRALKEMVLWRMEETGVNGAGSSVDTPADLDTQAFRAAVSVEGRKSVKFVPFSGDYQALRERFLIGHTVCGDLFTEDLDDFLEGLCNGLSAGLVVHAARDAAPEEGWRELFAGLGRALREALSENPARRGVPPGVKATMA